MYSVKTVQLTKKQRINCSKVYQYDWLWMICTEAYPGKVPVQDSNYWYASDLISKYETSLKELVRNQHGEVIVQSISDEEV